MGLTIFKQFLHNTLLMFYPSSEVQRRVKGKREERRWQLFHAMDFQSLMYPCFTFCRILGLFPYKINSSSFENSKTCYILSTVIVCGVCLYTLIIFYVINISGWSNDKNLRRIIDLNAFYILGCFIMVVTYILNGPRMHLLQTILKISSGLPLESYQKQSRLIHTKDLAGFFFLLVQPLTIFSNVQYSVLITVFSSYITLLVFQMDMLYMNCVCVLKTCFKRINDSLTNLLVMNDKPHLFRWIYHEQRNRFLLMELKALKKQHLRVSGTVRMLNMIFSLQLLATVVITFARITFFLFFCLMLWKDVIPNVTSLEKQFHYVYFISSTVFYFIKMALIVWACETGKDQAIEIGITIHDLFNSINDEQIKNEATQSLCIRHRRDVFWTSLKRLTSRFWSLCCLGYYFFDLTLQLELFSLQILHTRQNTFSAKGVTMDASLLATLTGSIVTYMLVLKQFQDISNSCDK